MLSVWGGEEQKEPHCTADNFTNWFDSLGTPVQACGFLLLPCESLAITGWFINRDCCSKLRARAWHRQGGVRLGERLPEQGWGSTPGCGHRALWVAPWGSPGSAVPAVGEAAATWDWGRGHAWRRHRTQPGCGGQSATTTGHGSVVSPPTRHVCAAANPCCQEQRRDRAVTEPGQAAPLLLLAHLHQIAVYNWIKHLFFKGYTLHPIKIHVFFRWSHLRWLVSQLLPWCAGCWHFHFPLLASSSHTRCLLDHRRITRASKEFELLTHSV